MKRIFFLILNSLILFATVSVANAQSIFQNIEDPRQLEQVKQGRKVFNRDWQAFPGVNPNGDGLGPVFNRVSCSGCHFQAGRGRPPESPDEPFTSMVLRLGFTDELGSRAHIAYGEQLNDRSLPNIPAEGRPSLSFRTINGQYVDGERYTLRMPQYDVKDLGFGQLGWAIQFSGRVAQPLQGIGFLEAIPQEVLDSWADPNDLDGDGISGRVAMVMDQSGNMLPARFGWKAAQVSLFSQTAQALHQDMGLTSSLHLEQNCAWKQLACRAAPKETGPEVNAAQLDQLVSFQRALSPRSQQNRNELGRHLFNEIGSIFERIIYQDGDISAKQCEILRAVASNIYSIAKSVHQSWVDPEYGYGGEMKFTLAENELYTDELSVTADLFTNLWSALQWVEDNKIRSPLREDVKKAKPRRMENWRSSRSFKNISIDVAALKGSYETLLRSHVLKLAEGTQRDTLILDNLNAASTISQELENVKEESIKTEPTWNKMLDMAVHLKEARGQLFAVAKELSIPVGFNSLDGD